MTILQEDSKRDQKTATWKAEAFSATFDKARKSYGFATALLLAWALIGIDLQPDVLSNYKLTLKSPQAAPWVLVAAVLYFGFRLTIEWFQTNPARRKMLASRTDFYTAHLLGVLAVSVFLGQKLLQGQLANLFSGRTRSIAYGVIIGLGVGAASGSPMGLSFGSLRLTSQVLGVLGTLMVLIGSISTVRTGWAWTNVWDGVIELGAFFACFVLSAWFVRSKVTRVFTVLGEGHK
jgi:hypothetical protein